MQPPGLYFFQISPVSPEGCAQRAFIKQHKQFVTSPSQAWGRAMNNEFGTLPGHPPEKSSQGNLGSLGLIWIRSKVMSMTRCRCQPANLTLRQQGMPEYKWARMVIYLLNWLNLVLDTLREYIISVLFMSTILQILLIFLLTMKKDWCKIVHIVIHLLGCIKSTESK